MTSMLLMSALLTLPAAQGPTSRLSDARFVPATDTMDTWDRRSDQPRRKDSASYIQALSHLPSGDWQIRREWRDSLGTVTSVGTTVLSARDLATRFDADRAPTDSAVEPPPDP